MTRNNVFPFQMYIFNIRLTDTVTNIQIISVGKKCKNGIAFLPVTSVVEAPAPHFFLILAPAPAPAPAPFPTLFYLFKMYTNISSFLYVFSTINIYSIEQIFSNPDPQNSFGSTAPALQHCFLQYETKRKCLKK